MRARRFLLLLWIFAGSAKADGVDPKKTAEQAKGELGAKLDATDRARLGRGLDQIAALWRPSDGDLVAFAREHFLPSGRELDATFDRFEHILEQVEGHELEIGRALQGADRPRRRAAPARRSALRRRRSDGARHRGLLRFEARLRRAAQLPADHARGAARATARATRGDSGRRRASPAGSRGASPPRSPAEIARADADRRSLHRRLQRLDAPPARRGRRARLFPKGMRLISHWNLRDELKADYADKDGLAKQRTIVKVMERIVTQTIPAAVIDNPRLDWNPFTNAVTAAPAGEIEADAPARPAVPRPVARARRALRASCSRTSAPRAPPTRTRRSRRRAIARSFELGREIPEERVARMLVGDPRRRRWSPKVAGASRRGSAASSSRSDLWYNGFQPRAKFTEAELDALTRKRYPTAAGVRRPTSRASCATSASPPSGRSTSPSTSSSIRRAAPATRCRRSGAATSRTCARASRRTA